MKLKIAFAFEIFSGSCTGCLVELPYKMILIAVSRHFGNFPYGIFPVLHKLFGVLDADLQKILFGCDSENLSVKRIETGRAQVYGVCHVGNRPILVIFDMKLLAKCHKPFERFVVGGVVGNIGNSCEYDHQLFGVQLTHLIEKGLLS